MLPTDDALNQDWMSLWLAVVEARVDVAVHEAAGVDARGALALVASLEAEIERMRVDAQRVPAAWLRTRLGLSPTEETVVWLLVASAASSRLRAALLTLGGGQHQDPSLEVIQRVVYREPAQALAAWRELSQEGALRQLGLIADTDDGQHRIPDYRRTVHLTERIRGLVLGDTRVPPELADLAESPSAPLLLDEVVASKAAIAQARAHVGSSRAFVIATGAVGSGRTTLLRAAAHDASREVLVVEGARLAPRATDLRIQLQALAREALLLDRVLLIRNVDALLGGDGGDERGAILEALLRRTNIAVLATARVCPNLRSRRAMITLELGVLTTAQRATLWGRVLAGATETELTHIATMFPMSPSVIDAIGRTLVARGVTEPDAEALLEVIAAVVDERLAGLAERVTVTQGWDDLVLPTEQRDAITELTARVQERGRVYETWGFARKLGKGLGVAALFSGPPGTGKTMAAGLIAQELGLQLYRVDLSQMVSKFIGETEKNLAALFDAAESTHAILLFDEADSLFGKRTDVKSSNDRYANLEVNYMLQRLETFTGICILTTNHERAIDEAFRRRLAFHVRFPMPEDDERAHLWRAMLPKDAPVDPAVDFCELAARHEMSGGHIRNAVLRAAFFAAHARSAITMAQLWRAASVECEAMGKLAPTSTPPG